MREFLSDVSLGLLNNRRAAFLMGLVSLKDSRNGAVMRQEFEEYTFLSSAADLRSLLNSERNFAISLPSLIISVVISTLILASDPLNKAGAWSDF